MCFLVGATAFARLNPHRAPHQTDPRGFKTAEGFEISSF